MSSSEIIWKSKYYGAAVSGSGFMSSETEGQIDLTLFYSNRSVYKPGARVVLKMDCRRDDEVCYAQGQYGGQTMKLAIPLDGPLTGTYISLNPVDHGIMEFKAADVEMLRKQVPISLEKLIEPPEFEMILSRPGSQPRHVPVLGCILS